MIVRAAGGVLLRRSDHALEVLLVHRPRYDDWSLPKGKRDPGETDEQCAVREVFEETAYVGHLGRELLPTRYVDRHGRDKVVRWWEMTIVGEHDFVPGNEIDDRRWVSTADAASLASHHDDVALIALAAERRA